MKLSNRQKNSILKLNEDFFDDLDDNDLIDDPVNEPDDFFDEPIDNTDYTYNIYFIIYINPFIKEYKEFVSKNIDECKEEPVYSFEENPEYKPIIESAFLSMKKALNCILQATPIVTDYSEPKFCTSIEKIIKAFPFMVNSQSNEFENKLSHNIFVIKLKTSINISGRKNVHNLTKLLYSFWRLQQIYNKLVIANSYLSTSTPPHINMGVYKKNPFKKSILCELMPSDRDLTSTELELIKFLNDKDETDE